MTNVGLDLADGGWPLARQLIDQPVGSLTAADPVESGAVRRLLEVHEWDYPPSYDVSAAKACGHDRQFVPASTYLTWAMPAYWRPGGEPIGRHVIPPLPYRTVPGEGSMMIATNVRVNFLRPVFIGDLIHSTYWLRSVVPKRTSVGRGAFLTFEAQFSTGEDELVAVEHTTAFRYSPWVDESPTRKQKDVALKSDNPTMPAGGFPVDQQEITLTLQRLVMAAGANRDFAPVHHDCEVATASGLNAPFANSMFVGTHLERTAIEWAHWTSRTNGLSFRLLRPSAMGTVMRTDGWAQETSDSARQVPRDFQCHLQVRCDQHQTAVGSVSLTSASRSGS